MDHHFLRGEKSGLTLHKGYKYLEESAYKAVK